MITLITNIKELLQVRETSISKVSGAEMAILPTIKNAFLILKDNLIHDFGSMENLPEIKADKTIDATGQIILHLGATVTRILFMPVIVSKSLWIESMVLPMKKLLIAVAEF